jgi:hypothetical protein
VLALVLVLVLVLVLALVLVLVLALVLVLVLVIGQLCAGLAIYRAIIFRLFPKSLDYGGIL